MRLNKFIFLVIGSLCFRVSAQVDRSGLVIKTPPPAFDLIKESDSLQVLHEESVQKIEPESRHVITFGIGEMTAQSLTLTSNNDIVNYDLTSPTPIFSGSLGYYPARFNGYWGLISSVGYSYHEQNSAETPTTLHLFTGDLLLSYRYEKSTRSWLKPYIGIGPGINIVVQRGIDELNTSEAHGLAVGTLGLGFNVKRLLDMTSPLDWELNLQYKRWIDVQTSNADYNGQVLSLGLSMIL